MSASLQAGFTLRRPHLQLDVQFTLSASWTCLFGASGSGKSTILRAVAGFMRPDHGSITLGEQALFDPASRINLPAHQRPVRFAAQRSFLFPGTVRANVLYGVQSSRRQEAEAVLGWMDLTPLAGSRAAALSGGEQQRVAIARAVAAALYGPEPAKLLLLDEPFNGMDAARRDVLAVRLRDHLATAGLPVLSVTHDTAEVFLLGAAVMRLEGGHIAAHGPAATVLANERERLLRTLSGA